jgi:hypothetical protein
MAFHFFLQPGYILSEIRGKSAYYLGNKRSPVVDAA